MLVHDNDCCGCPSELGCLGKSCPHGDFTYHECDGCGSTGVIYDFNGKELCKDCLVKAHENIETDEKKCDKCGEYGDAGILYLVDGDWLCEDCLMEEYEVVEDDY